MSKKDYKNRGVWKSLKESSPIINNIEDKGQNWVVKNSKKLFYGLWAAVLISFVLSIIGSFVNTSQKLNEKEYHQKVWEKAGFNNESGDDVNPFKQEKREQINSLFLKREMKRVRNGETLTPKEERFIDSLIQEIQK